MYKSLVWCTALVSLVIAGCAKQQIYRSDPPLQTVSTSDFELTLEPLKAEGYDYYNRFSCQFTNKSNDDLTIDWSETYYLRNGKRFGRFGWEGMTFEQLREVEDEPTVDIGPGKKDAIEIFPLRLIGWREEGVRLKATTPEAGFTHTPLPAGENGMSIAVRKDGELIRQRVLVNISLK